MKIKKIIVLALLIYILINILNITRVTAYASDIFGEIIDSAKSFTEDSVTTTVPVQITTSKLQATSKIVSSVLFTIAIAVALITTATLGINFMIQSTEEKAKTKEALVPLVVGMFISFGAYAIWKIMVAIFVEL